MTPTLARPSAALLRDRPHARAAAPRSYADPYLTGFVLGLVLLAAFVLVGRGLGATGAFASVAATAVNAVSSNAAQGNSFFGDRLPIGGILDDLLGVENAGGFLGGGGAGAPRPRPSPPGRARR